MTAKKKSADDVDATDGGAVSPGSDVGEAEVQAVADTADEQGFLGSRVDPTPLANYTVAGVTSGAPTPETDEAAAAAAREEAAAVSASFDGPTAQQQ